MQSEYGWHVIKLEDECTSEALPMQVSVGGKYSAPAANYRKPFADALTITLPAPVCMPLVPFPPFRSINLLFWQGAHMRVVIDAPGATSYHDHHWARCALHPLLFRAT